MSHLLSPHRYAIYFAPQESTPLHHLGSNWLGRDTCTGEQIPPELPVSISYEAWQAATEAPRRYGFHATLKPPFKLAPGVSAEDLKTSLQGFAASHKAFSLPPLSVGTLGRFLALILSAPSADLHELAADCVRDLDFFRAAPEAAELANRMHPSMNSAEQQNLVTWGYPYVFDTWKFHMTLTNSLKPDDLGVLREHLLERFSAVCEQPLLCDSICLFEEPLPNTPLRLVARYSLSQ